MTEDLQAKLNRVFDIVSLEVDEFAGDMTENEPRRPAYVVTATSEDPFGWRFEIKNLQG